MWVRMRDADWRGRRSRGEGGTLSIASIINVDLMLAFALALAVELEASHAGCEQLTDAGQRRALKRGLVRLDVHPRSIPHSFETALDRDGGRSLPIGRIARSQPYAPVRMTVETT